MDILKAELFAGHIDIRYVDGSREEIEAGIYERKNSEGDTVEQRLATGADTDRLTALALDHEAAVKPLDALVVDIQIAGASIDIYYDDGRKESLEDGFYEIKNANNDTIFERAATQADTDRLLALEIGQTGGGDVGTGTGELNVIEGTVGDDRDLEGTNGDDQINGLAGEDRIRGRNGNDELYGGDGDDRLRGDGGNDIVYGGAGDDRVFGKEDDDIVYGGAGDDRVFGNDGDDMVFGDAGNDRVKGGSGTDTIDGGEGSDKYWGGLGADTFIFGIDGVGDRIKDFEDGVDLIDVSAFGVTDISSFTVKQKVNDVVVVLGGGDIIRIDDATVEQITDADFLF